MTLPDQSFAGSEELLSHQSSVASNTSVPNHLPQESISPLPSYKRNLSSDTVLRSANKYASRTKRSKYDDLGEQFDWPSDRLTTTTLPLSNNSPPLARNRSSASVHSLSIDAVVTMLDIADDKGNPRTVRLARGTVGSPSPKKTSLLGVGRHPSDQNTPKLLRTVSDAKSNPSKHLLGAVQVTEFLEQDDRPTFVIDVGDDTNYASGHLNLIFVNSTLKTRPALLADVSGKSDDPTILLDLSTPFSEFKAWALTSISEVNHVAEGAPSFLYAGAVWKTYTLRKRLRVFSGQLNGMSLENIRRTDLQRFQGLSSSSSTVSPRMNLDSPGYFDSRPQGNLRSETPARIEDLVHASFPDEPPDSELNNGLRSPAEHHVASPARDSTEGCENVEMGSIPDQGFFDWTRLPLSDAMPSHIHFARSINWGATSLGPIETWSADLRAMCNLIMASPHPAAMYWGKDHVAIYNEAYILLAGQKHPSLMGNKYSDAWSEIWDALAGVFDNAYSTAQATMKDDDCLFLARNGFLEETYFSWSLIPLIGEDGTVVGTYNPAFEKTRRKIAERRMLTLREIGERTAVAREVSQFWGLVLEGLAYNEYDAPLVMVYSLQDDVPESDAASANSSTTALGKQCFLEGTLGISPGHPAAPAQFDLRFSTQGFGAAFRHALTQSKPVVLREEDGTLDMKLFDDIQWRGFGDPSKVVVVSPIQPTSGESTLGFLVMATNPRRPYDEDYDLFVQLLGRQLATSVASVVLFEEEIKKGEQAARLAAQDRIDLSNQLAARTQEAIESENKFTRMAELAPVGMFFGDETGSITYCNDTWHDLSSYPRHLPVGDKWLGYVKEEDQQKTSWTYQKMLRDHVPISVEFRFNTPWKDASGNVGDTWVLASAYPEKDEDGQLKRVFGSVTNISTQKFAEEMQTRRMQEAVEMKRQQTNFIDITSHEMRNPLGAILLSSDEIITTLTQLRTSSGLTEAQIETLDNNIDSAQTIELCAQHQKRIVDDVLTLSKLDSAVLLVTPVDAQPVNVIQRALKIFETELQSADITLDFRMDPSYQQYKIDWVRLDPFRLSQVLINLTTNAIKFTTTQEKRTILVHLAASEDRPSQEDKYGLTFIPSRASKTKDNTAAAEWGVGEPVYIHFAVQDTGRGLTEEEKERLFQRFSQANPRTHVTYGGSGLGLFICRELVELQGGEIGVASKSGEGSTFAFYVKGRRSKAPTVGSGEKQIDLMQGRKGSSKGSKLPATDGAKPLATKSLAERNLSPANPATPPMSAETGPSQLRIMIVEDNLINQKVLGSQLRKAGCTVYIANHGGEAIDQIKQSAFYRHPPTQDSTKLVEIDVVLMDLEMPVMDGQTCAKELRKMEMKGELVGHIPIIAVTANARAEQIQMTLDSGMDDVLSKPFRLPELLAKVKMLLARLDGAGK